jgi:hypothetical protein
MEKGEIERAGKRIGKKSNDGFFDSILLKLKREALI